MALVRCPKHKIPYNDTNPRGCPACAVEKEGGRVSSQLGAMQELARASQMVKRPSGTLGSPEELDKPVTAQPRIPIPVVTRITQLLWLLRTRRVLTIGSVVAVFLVFLLFASSAARFTDALSPANYPGVVRPFPILPNDPIQVVFSAVGPQNMQPNPTARTLERYSYGTDLYVDALNGSVYAITIAVPNRSWHGLRVGMTQTNAEGAMAMLGPPREVDASVAARADTVSGFIVYRSLDARPRRTLLAEVRPPNNCFDVLVDLQPRAIGILTRKSDKWAVVSRVGGVQEWVVTRVRAVSRSKVGPYAGEPAC